MLNPYQATTTETGNVDASLPPVSPSIVRGFAAGLLGYIAPFGILCPLFWLWWGWTSFATQISEFAAWHLSPTLVGFAHLAPHFGCMLLFAVAGYRRPFRLRVSGLRLDALGLALATLLGYFVMLVIIYTLNPLPWTWPPIRTGMVQSGFVALFPIGLIFYGLLTRSSSKSA